MPAAERSNSGLLQVQELDQDPKISAQTLKIIVAEDSAILRDGLIALLTRRGFQVHGVGDGSQLVSAVSASFAHAGQPVAGKHDLWGTGQCAPPGIVVADIRMPPTHSDEGLQAALTLRATHPNLPILLFSQYVEAAMATRLLATGAAGVGYLLKDRVTEVTEFVTAIRRVAAGETVLDPEVVSQLVAAAPQDTGLARLTTRELEVLALMAQGRSNAAIAQELYLSAGAVEKNVAAIFTKLDLPPTAADNRRVLAVLRYLNH